MAKGIQYRSRVDLSVAIKRQIERIQTSTFIQIVDASSTSAVIGIAIDNDVADSKFFNLKKNGEIKEADGFDKFYIRCDAQPNEWVDIIVVENSEDFHVKNPDESVTTITGAVMVKNETAGSLETNNPNLETLIKNDKDQREPLTTIAGATFAVAIGVTTELVTAAANVNGIIIRVANCVTLSNVYAEVLINDNPILSVFASSSGSAAVETMKNFFIPAGSSLKILSGTASAETHIWYEKL